MTPKATPAKNGKTIRSRIVLATVLLLAAVVLLEAGAMAVYQVIFKKPLSRADIQKRLLVETAAPGKAKQPWEGPLLIRNHILHPYLGFVANPGTYAGDEEFSRNGQTAIINEQGFLGPSPLAKPAANSINICILGGSFAKNFYLDSRDTLAAELKKRDFYKNRPINITSVAMSGWKQPQQLLGLTYLLALGAHFDVVVNLDGYNEVALPASENGPDQVNSFYPRKWQVYASRTVLPDDILVKLSDLAAVKEKLRARKKLFGTALLRRSNFCLLLFEELDRRSQRQIAERQAAVDALMNQETRQRTPEITGPDENYKDATEFFTAMADFWAQCSRQMDGACRANGIAYLHALQPNQYVPGSKPMGAAERQVTWLEGESDYKSAVQNGYPRLISNGRKLQQAGVHFVDLTMMFKEMAEPLYEDACCHLNQRGNDLVAAKLAEQITAIYPRQSRP